MPSSEKQTKGWCIEPPFHTLVTPFTLSLIIFNVFGFLKHLPPVTIKFLNRTDLNQDYLVHGIGSRSDLSKNIIVAISSLAKLNSLVANEWEVLDDINTAKVHYIILADSEF